MKNEKRLQDILEKISELASSAVKDGYVGNGHTNGDSFANDLEEGVAVCTPKVLPKRLLESAAKTAIKINPVNAPLLGPVSHMTADFPVPLALVLVTSKYWGPKPRRLTVSFMESTSSDLKARILSHMNAWGKTVCISFALTQGQGDVRISRGTGGYWSYLGTDILHIPKNRQTMNLQGFTMNTLDSEYKRVIRHETGHTLGFPHEHMRKELVARIDPAKAYVYFLQTQGWNKQTVDQQVLTPLDESSIIGTPPDQTSIMCYQLPGAITRDGKPILGGIDINQTDYTFAGKVYPLPGHTLMPEAALEDDWDETEDVAVPFEAMLS